MKLKILNTNAALEVRCPWKSVCGAGAHLDGLPTDGGLRFSRYSRILKCAWWEFRCLHQLYGWPPRLPLTRFGIDEAVLNTILKHSICKYHLAWHIYSVRKNVLSALNPGCAAFHLWKSFCRTTLPAFCFRRCEGFLCSSHLGGGTKLSFTGWEFSRPPYLMKT